jgi:hypothetical protein
MQPALYRLKFVTGIFMKIRVSWDMTLCKFVNSCLRFREAFCLLNVCTRRYGVISQKNLQPLFYWGRKRSYSVATKSDAFFFSLG